MPPRHPLTAPRAFRKAWPYPDAFVTINGVDEPVRMTPAPNGQWVRKLGGKQYRFGAWRDSKGTDFNELARRALARFRVEWPIIVRGGDPAIAVRPRPGTANVERVCEAWAQAQLELFEAGKLSEPTYRKYVAHANAFAELAGYDAVIEAMTQADFRRLAGKIAKRYAVSSQGDMMVRIRSILRWAKDEGLIQEVPNIGRDFRGPSRKERRAHQQQGKRKAMPRLLILRLLAHASPQWQSVVLLGINGGFGPADCRRLHQGDIDRQGVIDTTRAKTGELRIVPLWPETLAALNQSWGDDGYLVSGKGMPWGATGMNQMWGKLIRRADVDHPATHYWLRHTLRTIGGKCSRPGVRIIMGQRVGDEMDEVYDHDHEARIELARQVSEHVRRWLYGGSASA